MAFIKLILLALFGLTALIFTVFGVVYFYHFKRFGLPDDPNVKKILNLFRTGGIVLILFSLVFLIIILI